MSDKTLKTNSDLLNEEKWTRATLNSYTINNFKELDVLIKQTLSEEIQNEVKTLCDEHLSHTKNSIIALYISGILALSRQMLDDSNLLTLISIFQDNHKWNVVEFLCNRMLEFGENKYALRILADCYESENESDKKYDIWERLVKVDYEEADIVRLLAERKEAAGDKEAALMYYKRAIHRYLNKKLFANVKDIWNKLIEYSPDDVDFFFYIEKKVAKTLTDERASQLLEDLYAALKKEKNWDRAIEVLKRILEYDPKNSSARKEIIACYREKYSYNTQLEEYIKLSNLNQGWRNIHEAIEDFEKHISFDAGSFVYHRTWGIGRIASIKNDMIVIDFARKRGHEMSVKMAVSALTSLSKDHIWVLKTIWPKEKLKEKVQQDPAWALKTIIASSKNGASLKDIKNELCPSVLSPSEWTSWSVEARHILKTDPHFGNLPDSNDQYVIREKPISFEEKTYNRFKAEKEFFARYEILMEFLDNADPESEYFGEMFSYFTAFLKSENAAKELIVSSYLVVQKIIHRYPFLNQAFSFDFKDFIANTENIEELFSLIEAPELKRMFLEQLKQQKDWPDLFVRLFPYYLSNYIIDELHAKGQEAKAKEIFTRLLEDSRDEREALIWAARNLSPSAWSTRYGISYEKVLIALVHLLDITYRDINNKRDVSLNRKYNKQIHTYLFGEHNLENYLLASEQDAIIRIITLLDDIKDLEKSIVIELKHKVMEKYPSIRFLTETGKETVSTASRGLIVTRESYDAKQKQLQYILEVEIPKNSREIGAAIELGDLSENAEYKAGKEKQEMLNFSVSKLREELDRAQIWNETDIDTSKVSFGTVVRMKNLDTGKEEVYTILGPWESDPEKNIISYLSPFGGNLLNHKEGETLEFTINERTYRYTIIQISGR